MDIETPLSPRAEELVRHLHRCLPPPDHLPTFIDGNLYDEILQDMPALLRLHDPACQYTNLMFCGHRISPLQAQG